MSHETIQICNTCGPKKVNRKIAGSARITVENKTHTVNLCASHLKDLKGLIGTPQPKVQTNGNGHAKSSGRRPKTVAVDAATVRQWAIENGYEVNRRGRISSYLMAEYQSA